MSQTCISNRGHTGTSLSMTKAVLVLWSLFFLSGCGAAATAIGVIVAGSGSSSSSNGTPSLIITSPSQDARVNDLITIEYNLLDSESNSVNITVEYSIDDGQTWSMATELPGTTVDTDSDGVVSLSSSPSGVEHKYVWNSFADIIAINVDDALIRFTPVDASTGNAGVPITLELEVFNQYSATILGRLQPDNTEVPYFPAYLHYSFNVKKCFIANHKTNTITSIDVTTGESKLEVGTGLTSFNGDNNVGGSTNINQPGQMVEAFLQSVGGNALIFADSFNHRIRALDLDTGFITTIAGIGTAGYSNDTTDDTANFADAAFLNAPRGVDSAFFPSTNSQALALAISEEDNRTIRVINFRTQDLTFYNGINFPLSTDPLKTTIKPSRIRTVAGHPDYPSVVRDGPVWVEDNTKTAAATFKRPRTVRFFSSNPPVIMVADERTIRMINLGDVGENITVFPNAGGGNSPLPLGPAEVVTILGKKTLVASSGQNLTTGSFAPKIDLSPGDIGDFIVVQKNSSTSIDVTNGDFNILFTETTGSALWVIDGKTGLITRLAGSATKPPGFSGDGGSALDAQFNQPQGIAFTNNVILLADQFNNRVRAYNSSSTQTVTVANKSIGPQNVDSVGEGPEVTEFDLAFPYDIVSSPDGKSLFISDLASHRVIKFELSTRAATTVVGTGKPDSAGDGGSASEAEVGNPTGVDVADTEVGKILLVADNGSNFDGRIRLVNFENTSNMTFGHVSNLAPDNIQTLVGGGSTRFSSGNDLENVDPLTVKMGIVLDVFTDNPDTGKLPAVYIVEETQDASDNIINRILVYNPNSTPLQFNISGAATNPREVQAGKVSAIAISTTGTGSATDPLDSNRLVGPGNMDVIGGARESGANTNLVILFPTADKHMVIGINYSASTKTVTTVDIPTGRSRRLVGGLNGNPGFNGDLIAATSARLSAPLGVFHLGGGSDPEYLLVSDSFNQRIRLVVGDPTTADLASFKGLIITVAGTGKAGYNGDTLPPLNTFFNAPLALQVTLIKDNNGKSQPVIYIVDSNNGRIRRIVVAD